MTHRRKIMTIFGARPEGIKMAPVIRALRRYPDWFDVVVVSTGQHREQLDMVFRAFDFQPDHDLAIMQPRQSLASTMVRALSGLDEVLTAQRPDLVMVHGDTLTTAAGSLISFYHQTPLAHVEAGLRTFAKFDPFPEEINRRMAGLLADIHFAPTPTARAHLLREQVDAAQIFVSGQTGVDAVLDVVGRPHRFEEPALRELDLSQYRVVTVTAHRRENLGEPMTNMFRALRDLADKHADLLLIYPVHLNPAVREVAWPILGGHPRIRMLEPLGYQDMMHLVARSYLVMTDSGGLQEDTPSLGVPLVLMRETTERPEAVEAGVVVLSGTSYQGVFSAGDRLLSDPVAHGAMAALQNPFGDGQASERIAAYLAWHYKLLPERPREFSPGARNIQSR